GGGGERGAECWRTKGHDGVELFRRFCPVRLPEIPPPGSGVFGVERFEEAPERAKRLASMTDGCLSIAGLRERLSERRVKENRIVAEAAIAFWLGRDARFAPAARLEE